MKITRKSGILLHISSLPSEYGIGDLGSEAYDFIDKISENGIKIWQILPLGPLGPGNSPYQAYSAYAGDPLYISPRSLKEWDLLTEEDLAEVPNFNRKEVEFDLVRDWKNIIFEKAWSTFQSKADISFKHEYTSFLNEHGWWLDDYALYSACRKENGGDDWTKWDIGLKTRKPETMNLFKIELHESFEMERFKQFMFFRQWFKLKKYANEKGVSIFGDIPLYVSHDSSDVWGNQNNFYLDESGEPEIVGGVPPDYFCEDGQLWGNPVFNWDEMEKNTFQWWIARLYFNFHMFDIVRIDHFRGLESFWAIPKSAESAKEGRWMPAKGFMVLKIMQSRLGNLPIVAEDLGIITEEVEKLRDHFNLPGMRVLQFAFTSDETNDHLPHNITHRNYIYTGTHDNNTIIGWWNELTNEEKKKAQEYLKFFKGSITERVIEWAWSSNAEISIVPLQDVMKLGSEARMNIPGTAEGNWKWRYTKNQLRKCDLELIRKLNKKYNR